MKLFKEIQTRIFPILIALSALSVSASAAFYSITGLSKLFAGASIEVIIMASSLELAKLVIASLLYQYWGKLNRLLKIYLTVAAVVLVLITSAGIYGFLSAAYQETATKSEIVDSEVEVLEMRKQRFEENRGFYMSEKSQLDEGIAELRKGLSNNVIQYRDSQTGQIITTTSSSTRQALQSQLDDAIKRRDDISTKLERVSDSISSLDIEILNVQSNTDLSSELGPLKYLSNLTGTPMNKIINILLLIIIFVFDPLAISLVIAANFAFDQIKKKNKETKIEEDNNDLLIEKELSVKDYDDVLVETLTDELDEIEKNEKTIEKIDIENIPIEEESIEKDMVEEDDKPLNSSQELIERLQRELEKLMAQKEEQEKTTQLTADFIEKVNKLSEVIDLGDDKKEQSDEKELKEEEKVTPNLNKKRITYRRRDGGENTRIERI